MSSPVRPSNPPSFVYPTRSRVDLNPFTIEDLTRIPITNLPIHNPLTARPPVSRFPASRVSFTPAAQPTQLPSATQATPTVTVDPKLNITSTEMINNNRSVYDSDFITSGPSTTSLAPKMFMGTDKERVDDWLVSFNWYAEIHKWEDASKCKALRRFLDGKAKLWYDSIRHRLNAAGNADDKDKMKEEKIEEAKELLSNWSALEAAMRKYFEPQDVPMMIRFQLQNRHQFGNEKVADYALLKQTLIDRIDPYMSEEEKLQYFLFGLSPQLQSLVIPQNPKTLEDAIRIARDHERGLSIANGTLTINNIGINQHQQYQQPFPMMHSNPVDQMYYMPQMQPNPNYYYDPQSYNVHYPPTYDVNALVSRNAVGAVATKTQSDVVEDLKKTVADLRKELQTQKDNRTAAPNININDHNNYNNNYRNSGRNNNNYNGGSGYQHGPGWIAPSSGACFYCHKFGHSKRNCKKLRADEARSNQGNGNYNFNRNINDDVSNNYNVNNNINNNINNNQNNNQNNNNRNNPNNNGGNNNRNNSNNNGNGNGNNRQEEKKAEQANVITVCGTNNGSTFAEDDVVNSTSVFSVGSPMSVEGKINNVLVTNILVDTGASITAVSGNFFRRLNIDPRVLAPTAIQVKSASASPLHPIGTIGLNVQLRDVPVGEMKFVVLDNLNTDAILGADVLTNLFNGIDLKQNHLMFKDQSIALNPRAHSRASVAGVYEVFTLHGISVPPYGEVITTDTSIKGRLIVYIDDAMIAKEDGTNCILLEPILIPELNQKVRAARAVYSPNQIIRDNDYDRIPIRLANFTDRTIELNAGVQLATVELVNADTVLIGSHDPLTTTTVTNTQVTPIINIGSTTNVINTYDAVTSDSVDVNVVSADVASINIEDAAKAIKTKDEYEIPKLKTLLIKYPQLFATNPKKPTQTTRTTHTIDTGDANPIKLHPYRNARVDDEFIEKEITQLLANKLIQRSNSPWSAPVVLVMKKGGDRRTCIDYRKLNSVTKKCSYPLPRPEDLIDSLGTKAGKKKYYSKLDLASAYWSVKMNENDREKTAFVTKQGLFEWLVMPFGLCNAPATFQRLMDEVLGELKFKCVVVYFDDIVIFSNSFEEHIIHLELVFKKLTEANLQAKLSKSEFGLEEVTFLGFIIGATGIRPDPQTVQAVNDFRIPRTVREVRSFIGLCSFYRTFILGFAAIANPLHHLTKKNVEFVWSDVAQSAFDQLKKALTSAPILASPEFGKPFVLTTDASKFALGAILSQVQEGVERVIRYASRSMNPAERNYSVTEKECLSIVWAIGMYRCYLLGTTFTIVTDHKPLVSLPKLKLDDPYGRLARWTLKLQHYDYTVVYKKGNMIVMLIQLLLLLKNLMRKLNVRREGNV